MGLNCLKILYKTFIVEDSFLVLVCFENKEKQNLIGYAVVRLEKTSYLKSVIKNYPFGVFINSFNIIFSLKKIYGILELISYQFYKNPTIKPHLKEKRVGELFNIGMVPKYQGKGIASEIVKRIKEKCASRKINSLYAVTGSDEIKTHNFYKKVGGTIAGKTTVHNNHESIIYKILI